MRCTLTAGSFDSTRETQTLMYAELVKGTDPEQILEMIEHIKPHENPNPVKTLRARYDEWKRTQPN